MANTLDLRKPLRPSMQGAAPAPGAPAPANDWPETILERRSGWRVLDLGELWRYRELLFFLTWRDVKVRYKQTALGVAWAVLQPLVTMVVFNLFLGRLAEPAPGGVPYPLFAFAGLLPWFFFANAIVAASQSVVGNQNLVTKVYFPRLIIPLGAVGAGLVDFGIGLGLLLILMPWWGVFPGWGLVLVPVLAAGLLIAALGMGVLLSALTVAYRDFRHAVPFMVQAWMFATPVIYAPAPAVGPRWQPLLALNPVYGVVANFRAAVLGTEFDLTALMISGAVGLALLLFGCLYFRRVERGFADVI